MANTFSQMYVQVVFAVQGRANIIMPDWKDRLNEYIAGTIRKKGQKPIIVNNHKDHVHAFMGIKPSACVSDLVRDIKNNSTNFINDNRLVKGKFQWQEGSGAFTYSRSHIDAVYKYILNQEQRHKRQTFKEEYLEILKKFEVEYDEKYLFEWIDL